MAHDAGRIDRLEYGLAGVGVGMHVCCLIFTPRFPMLDLDAGKEQVLFWLARAANTAPPDGNVRPRTTMHFFEKQKADTSKGKQLSA